MRNISRFIWKYLDAWAGEAFTLVGLCIAWIVLPPGETRDVVGIICIYVIKKDGGKKTTSTNKARLDYKKKTGKSLPKTTHVDHKDNNKHNDSKGNLRAVSRKKNIGKENKRRVGK